MMLTLGQESIFLRCGEATAIVATLGAELRSWHVKGRELLWNGASLWWDKTAPVLFPVVGASLDGQITIAGEHYPMPLHGFAKEQLFQIIDTGNEWVHLRLTNNEESVLSYPFSFQLDIRFVLEETRILVSFTVSNSGTTTLPYALGFHPGFAWKSNKGEVLFDQIMEPDIPLIEQGGFLSNQSRRVKFTHKTLTLSHQLFAHGALVFRNSRAHAMMLKDSSSFSVTMQSAGFQHFAIWSKPYAPFVALEAWTGHADWADCAKDFFERDSIISLFPGQERQHSIILSCRDKIPC